MSCSICMTDIIHTNKVVTPCEHSFCNTCLTHWLLTNTSCPMCRHKIGEQEDIDEEEEEDSIDLIEEYETTNSNNMNVISKYILDFESIMFDMIDDVEDGTYVTNKHIQTCGNKYVTHTSLYDRRKIIRAMISYDPINNNSTMSYSMDYNVPKMKVRRVKTISKRPKNIKKFCNNIYK